VPSCGYSHAITVLDTIIQSLSRAGEYNRDDQVAPAVILWPDKERQREPVLPVLPVLRERLPHLLTLGPYAANRKTGAAILKLDDHFLLGTHIQRLVGQAEKSFFCGFGIVGKA
jgi:hypothetical protein